MRKFEAICFLTFILFTIVSVGQESQLKYDFMNQHPLNQPLNPTVLLNDSSSAINSCKGCFLSTKPVFAFDNRFSTLTNPNTGKTRLISMGGIKLGVEFYGKFRFGFGYYTMRERAGIVIEESEVDTFTAGISFSYGTLFAEYVIYDDFKWEVSAPLQFGSGDANIVLFSQSLDSVLFDSTYTLPVVSIGVNAEYKFIPWLGLGAGVGYRQLIVPGKEVNQILSTPFFGFKVKLFVGDLYKCIFRPEVIQAQREEYNRMRRERHQARQKRREERRKQK